MGFKLTEEDSEDKVFPLPHCSPCNRASMSATQPREVILASTNPGKIRELQSAFDGILNLIPIKERFPDFPETDEPHDCFQSNAIHKALRAVEFTGMPVLAEDSGLCIHSLGNEPGVYSARYADDVPDLASTDRVARCIELVLSKMNGLEGEKRSAAYMAYLALAIPEGRVLVGHAARLGFISKEPRGNGGFGYDPIFIPK